MKWLKRTVVALLFLLLALLLSPLLLRPLGYYPNELGWKVAEIIAKTSKNPRDCYKIIFPIPDLFGPTVGEQRSSCIFTYASLMKDPSACELLLPSKYGLACLSEVGGELFAGHPCGGTLGRNEVYCNPTYSEGELKIESPQIENCALYKRKDLREWCLYTRTLRLGKYECSEIQHPVMRNDCEDAYAFVKKDPALCSALKNPKQRRYCEIRINTWLKYPQLRGSSYFGEQSEVE